MLGTRNMEKMKANILTLRKLPEQINTEDNAGISENSGNVEEGG